ncbi:hypothetical protein D0Y65_042307 [Glycine soja]|uniref:Uncharacterized protein n=1 Tax=Glycine soja TaxID=3848 RepID=A0A445GCF6_GLYSO|nr:hypothetical protein D0Y65_042307 [Glycine soja]
MEVVSELMGDAIDDALEYDEETEELVNRFLMRLELTSTQSAPAAKINRVAQAESTCKEEFRVQVGSKVSNRVKVKKVEHHISEEKIHKSKI